MTNGKIKSLKIISIILYILIFVFGFNTSFFEIVFDTSYWTSLMEEFESQPTLELEIKELDAWIDKNSNNPFIPSLALSVVMGDKIIYTKTMRSSMERLYSVASFTKTFTACAIFQLAEKRIIGLDDPVSDYLQIKFLNKDLPTVPMTIRHLLCHTSGLVDSDCTVQYEKNSTVYLIKQMYPAGYRFHYSNRGYEMLGQIITERTNQSLGTYLTYNLLIPLEMYNSKTSENIIGSGGLLCSVNDLSNYIKMLTGRGTYKGKKIISESMFEEIFKESIGIPADVPNKEFRGIAWRVWTIDGKPYSMNHAALWNGSGGWMQVFPTLNVGYVFMSDPENHDVDEFNLFYRGLKARLLSLTGRLSDRDLNPMKFKPSVPEIADLGKFTGIYRNSLNGAEIIIELFQDKYLTAKKYGSNLSYIISPVSINTFVYIFPDQTEKGLAFDFIYEKDKIIGLAVVDGFYSRL